MKYYYNIYKTNKGPITKEELAELAEKGIINEKTPVIEEGGKAWSRWGVISGESNKPQSALPRKTPTLSAASPLKTTSPLKVAPAFVTSSASSVVSENTAESFDQKIHSFFHVIDQALESKETGKKDDESLEDFKKKFSKPGAIVGVATLACFLLLGLSNGMYKNMPLFAIVLVAGCLTQYICYHAYNAMTPLLFGSRIKISSMGALRALALGLAIPILSQVGEIIEFLTIAGDVKARVCAEVIVPRLILVLLYVSMGYALFNAKRFFVIVDPGSVTPGRELVNIGRAVLRAIFSALHLLTPILMILAAIWIISTGNTEIKYAEELSKNIKLLKTLMFGMSSVDFSLITYMFSFSTPIFWATLPVQALISYYMFSLVPDVLESILSIGDRDK